MKVLEFIRNVNYDMPEQVTELVSTEVIKEYVDELKILFGCQEDEEYASDLLSVFPLMVENLESSVINRSHWPIVEK